MQHRAAASAPRPGGPARSRPSMSVWGVAYASTPASPRARRPARLTLWTSARRGTGRPGGLANFSPNSRTSELGPVADQPKVAASQTRRAAVGQDHLVPVGTEKARHAGRAARLVLTVRWRCGRPRYVERRRQGADRSARTLPGPRRSGRRWADLVGMRISGTLPIVHARARPPRHSRCHRRHRPPQDHRDHGLGHGTASIMTPIHDRRERGVSRRGGLSSPRRPSEERGPGPRSAAGYQALELRCSMMWALQRRRGARELDVNMCDGTRRSRAPRPTRIHVVASTRSACARVVLQGRFSNAGPSKAARRVLRGAPQHAGAGSSPGTHGAEAHEPLAAVQRLLHVPDRIAAPLHASIMCSTRDGAPRAAGGERAVADEMHAARPRPSRPRSGR